MHQRTARQKPAGRLDSGDGRPVGVARLAVGLVHRFAGKKRHAAQIDAVRAHRVGHRQAVGLAELPLVRSHGRGRYAPARCPGRPRQSRRLAAAPRSPPCPCSGCRATVPASAAPGSRRDNRVRRHAGLSGEFLDQRRPPRAGSRRPGRVALSDRIDPDHRIFEIGAVGDRAVARQGSWGRRPDRGGGRAIERRMARALPIGKRTHTVCRAVVVIFDLGLGKRGLLDHRPQNRLRALVEPAIAPGTCRSRARSAPRRRTLSSCTGRPSRR